MGQALWEKKRTWVKVRVVEKCSGLWHGADRVPRPCPLGCPVSPRPPQADVPAVLAGKGPFLPSLYLIVC